MRIKYKNKNETFTEDRLISKEPIDQFKAWFDEACNTPQIFEPNAMFLATATKDGIPSVRPVLLKGYGRDGFKFYTNYESRKGHELVRIEGKAEKTSAEDSDCYFQSRPYSSQIGSSASKQSIVIAKFWQGQSDRLHDRIRFRRAKSNENIDNVLVHQGDNGWVYERLSP
ncbi:unnamed protein product, partial [Heterotrigona itama]